MIRRWSCINNFNIQIKKDFFLLSKSNKINIFKTSVNFKKIKSRYTKFKRKSITRVIHVSTFLIYTNVFKFWSKNYLLNKHLFKNQFLFNIFPKNAFFYNFNFIKNKNENIFYNFNFIFSSWVKNSYLRFLNINKTNIFFLKNNNITTAWYYSNLNLTNHTIPNYSSFEGVLYPFDENTYNVKYDINIFFDIFAMLNMQKIIELYKTVYLLFLFSALS